MPEMSGLVFFVNSKRRSNYTFLALTNERRLSLVSSSLDEVQVGEVRCPCLFRGMTGVEKVVNL